MPVYLITVWSFSSTLASESMVTLYLYPQDTAQILVHGGGVKRHPYS